MKFWLVSLMVREGLGDTHMGARGACGCAEAGGDREVTDLWFRARSGSGGRSKARALRRLSLLRVGLEASLAFCRRWRSPVHGHTAAGSHKRSKIWPQTGHCVSVERNGRRKRCRSVAQKRQGCQSEMGEAGLPVSHAPAQRLAGCQRPTGWRGISGCGWATRLPSRR